MRRVAIAFSMLAVSLPVAVAHSDVISGWADEFWLGTVAVYGGTPGGAATVRLFTFNSSQMTSAGYNDEPSFGLIGAQTLGGKANARSKAMFRFNVKNGASGYYSTSVTITRFYWAPANGLPSAGSSCVGGVQLGTSTQTFDSLSAGANNQRIQNRLLPVYDFSAQTGTGTWAYRDNLSGTSIDGGNGNQNSCYEINWQ